MKITTVDHQRETRSATGGVAPTIHERTEVYADGELLAVLNWTPALLRRMARNGWSREDYINRIVSIRTADDLGARG